jgi:Zn-dependent protease
MFSSLKLGKPFGIDLYVHGTFWLLPLFVLFGGVLSGDLSGAAFEVVVLLGVFGCVALHEVGHSLAARWYGIGTRDITLYPVGGVASLDRMPERPWHEIVVALAGPAVNVLIVLGLVLGLVVGNAAFPQSGWTSAGPDPAELLVARLLEANLFLALFNLIPAFPMDGGRVLRALLSTGMNRLAATRAAVGVGSVLAAGGFLFGLLHGPVTLVLVSGVVFLLGRAELNAVRAQEGLRWRRRYAESFDLPPEAEPARTDDRFTGWKWDPARRVWSEWRSGVLLREIYTA